MFNQYFGNYLLEKKILKPEELRQILEEQKSVRAKLGVLAIDAGYMNAAQVDLIHRLQAIKDRKFGELAIEEGYLTEAQADNLLKIQKRATSLLGQVLIEKGIFTFEKYEEVLLQYKQDSRLTEEEVQALKNNDIRRIAAIFLKNLSGGHSETVHGYLELFIRNLIRFIDDEVALEEASEADSYSFDYLVTQRIEGEGEFFNGFAATDAVLKKFASVYAGEELTEMDNLAADALSEFLNCQNGLFISQMFNAGTNMDMFPSEVIKGGILKPVKKLYVIPCNLSFGKIDLIFADELPDHIQY